MMPIQTQPNGWLVHCPECGLLVLARTTADAVRDTKADGCEACQLAAETIAAKEQMR